jgi:DNA-directed RNA polymerase subunit RPC12/RpoP
LGKCSFGEVTPDATVHPSKNHNLMPKPKEEKPLVIRCPNCRQVREPDYNETTRRYVCSICSEPVDAQVLIEKKKRGLK